MKGKVGSGLSELGNSLFLETPSEKLYVLGLKFLQEFENQVTQLHPQRFVVVADDVRGVLLDLNEGFCLLEEDDVALGCVFHLHVAETMLGTALGSKKRDVTTTQANGDESSGHREEERGRISAKCSVALQISYISGICRGNAHRISSLQPSLYRRINYSTGRLKSIFSTTPVHGQLPTSNS